MILLDSSQRDGPSFDGLIVFASQLAELGYGVAIDPAGAPERALSSQKYQAARFLADPTACMPDRLVVVIGTELSPDFLASLRARNSRMETEVVAIGRFASLQARLDCRSRLAHVLGREPDVVDLNEINRRPLNPESVFPLAASASPRTRDPRHPLRLGLVLSRDETASAATIPTLAALDLLRSIALRVITTREHKEEIEASRYAGIRVIEHGEFLPAILARQTDIAVFTGIDTIGDRMAALASDLIEQGQTVIDATDGAMLARSGAPALRGPTDLSLLSAYLTERVLPNLAAIERRTAESAWHQNRSITRLCQALALPEPAPAPGPSRVARKTMFLPTNGQGLGHARRCLLIADAMSEPKDVVFAAYPGCLPMIEGRSYPALPLVQRSDLHADTYANDIVNYLRLSDNLGPGDTLVFDGGYVFNSVYRTIVEQNLDAVWIRRGLWQPAHITPAALRRESAFSRVIVPEEAFDELNHDYSFGPNIHRVGPIVTEASDRPADRLALRARMIEALGSDATEVVVTMLGSGTMTERDAQTRFICQELDRRGTCLNLVVAWPGSVVPAALHHWKNTRVIQTCDALAYCRIADIVISAAGYNSFHECLYHGIPAIFMPQIAPTFDDQLLRARAASDRGLAETVLSSELMRLGREIRRFLDEGRAGDIREAIAAYSLPPRGTATAAALIGGDGR